MRWEALLCYEGPTPSMVFIDGDHSYEGVQADLAWACERGVPVVAGHDFNSVLHAPLVRAVHERFDRAFDLFGTVWIAKTRAQEPPATRAA